MSLVLIKAKDTDIPLIHSIQQKAFSALLERYQDFDTSPATETIERITQKMQEPFTSYYIIKLGDLPVGGIRVCDFGDRCRISPIFILSEHQGKGYGQVAMVLVEKCHPNAKHWELDTILQEERLCRLYEKLGYRKTGITRKIKDGMDIVFYEKII